MLDESLDPEENPAKEGRYRYTVAHEGGGHWRLHRYLLVKNPAQTTIFGGPTEPSVICRSSQAKEPIEWQADFYASCLLMPKKLVIEAWRERFGNTNARILKRKDRKLALQVHESAKSIPANVSEGRSRLGGDRAYLFSIAAGSNNELRTHLEVAIAFDFLAESQLGRLPALQDREARLLWGLIH